MYVGKLKYCANVACVAYLANDMQPFTQISLSSADLFEALFPRTERSIQTHGSLNVIVTTAHCIVTGICKPMPV